MRNTHVLGSWSAQDFIAGCWQKEPLLIVDAVPGVAGLIDKKDLFAIACNPAAEARLIRVDKKQADWCCEQGPFKAKDMKALPASHWTLLVQAVDQWRPDVAELLSCFDFLPRWRLDDIMVSYATQGGGVGPHFDYYDVFLLQASGTRRWQLGQRCDDLSPLRDHPDMKLLKHFKQTANYQLNAGDMLYVPAGLAHWGTASSDDCITISIGFRAASQRELLQMALPKIAQQVPEQRRYCDSKDSIDSDPFCINSAAVNNNAEFWKALDSTQIKEAFAQALGEYATEPRYPEFIDSDKTLSLKKLEGLLKQKKSLLPRHNKASRFAYRALDKNRAELYVDGETHNTSLNLAKAICHEEINTSLLRKAADSELLLTLINRGSLLL